MWKNKNKKTDQTEVISHLISLFIDFLLLFLVHLFIFVLGLLVFVGVCSIQVVIFSNQFWLTLRQSRVDRQLGHRNIFRHVNCCSIDVYVLPWAHFVVCTWSIPWPDSSSLSLPSSSSSSSSPHILSSRVSVCPSPRSPIFLSSSSSSSLDDSSSSPANVFKEESTQQQFQWNLHIIWGINERLHQTIKQGFHFCWSSAKEKRYPPSHIDLTAFVFYFLSTQECECLLLVITIFII